MASVIRKVYVVSVSGSGSVTMHCVLRERLSRTSLTTDTSHTRWRNRLIHPADGIFLPIAGTT